MTMLAVYRGQNVSLASDRLLLSPDEVIVCESATQMLQRLQQLFSAQDARIQEAVSQARQTALDLGRAEALRTTACALVEGWEQTAARAHSDIAELRRAVIVLTQQVVRHIAPALGAGDLVSAMATRAVEEMLPSQAVVVRVHPNVEAAVRACLQAQGRTLDALMIEVRGDPLVGEFDCTLETPHGQLLAGLDSQLQRIFQKLSADGEAP